MQNFICVDCKVDTILIGEYYGVHDYVWFQTGLSSTGGMLCISCIEDRLGYTLNFSHFTDFPINSSPLFYRSEQLLSRLSKYVKN